MLFPAFCDAWALSLSSSQLQWIGQKLWENESGGQLRGLVEWNAGEDFLSLGIGHFIWYPKGRRGPFEESFPELLEFLVRKGVRLPRWLAVGDPCPWNSRQEWLKEKESPKAEELRSWLAHTVGLQTEFAIERLRRSLPKMLAAAPEGLRPRIERNFFSLSQTPEGLFALVDYVNFKGDGTLPTERYRGEGWGLLQVLEAMGDDSSVRSFCQAAQAVLRRRVRNAPPERHEERWLTGWLHRVSCYRNPAAK